MTGGIIGEITGLRRQKNNMIDDARMRKEEALAAMQAQIAELEPKKAEDVGEKAALAANLERRKKLAKQGKRSTIATSPMGITGSGASKQKTLLGA